MKRLLSFLFILLVSLSCESPLLEHDKLSEWKPIGFIEGKKAESLNLYLNFRWIEGPFGSPSQESVFQLELRDLQNEYVDLPVNFRIDHYGWMPDMGHGSADDGLLVWKDTGRFQSEFFSFNMPGFWQMHFLIYKGEVLVETLIFDTYL